MSPRFLSVTSAALAFVFAAPPHPPLPVAAAEPLPPGALTRLGAAQLRHGEPVAALSFSPDGRTLASAGGDRVRLWDTATGQETAPFAHDLVSAVAFSPDGKMLASASGTGTICLWETAGAKQLRGFGHGAHGKVHAVAFSPDGKYLAAGNADKAVRLWDPATGQEVRSFTGHADQVWAVAFAPDGKSLAAGSTGLSLWEVDTGKRLGLLNPQRTVTGVAFTSEGRRLLTADGDGQARVWERNSGKEIESFAAPGSVAWDPHGRAAALGGDGHTVRHRDMQQGKELKTLHLPTGDDDVLAVSPDGKTLAAAGANGTIHLWDLTTGKEALPLEGHQSRIALAVFSADGAHVLSADTEGTVCRWDVRTAKAQKSARPPAVRALAISADGQRLLFLHPDGTIHLGEATDGKELGAWRGPRDAAVTCGALSADGNRLAIGFTGHPVHVWERTAPTQPPRLLGQPGGVVAVAFLPGGKSLAAVGNDGRTHYWDVATGTEVGPVGGVPAGAPLALAPDGTVAASAGEGGIIRLWEVATGKELRLVQGHPDAVHALVFSPDGRVLASGGADPFVRLWEVASGQELRRWAGHRGPVTAVAFAPDGRTLISGSTDTTLLHWDLANGRGTVAVALEPSRLDSLWMALADRDAPKAYDAVWTLAAAPKESVPFLLDRLQLFIGADLERVARLIADLDNDAYATRERATADLIQLGKLAEPLLKKTLAQTPSLEVQSRIERILGKIKGGVPWSQERLRLVRLIEILEKIGTPEARQGLEKLATRAPENDLRLHAQNALERLARMTAKRGERP